MSTQLQTTPLLVSSSSTSSSTSTPLLSSPSPSPHSLKKAWKEIHVESPWHWPTTWTWSSSQQAVAKWLTTLYLFTKTDIHNLVLPACTLNGVVHGVWGSTCMAWDPWILMGSMMKVGVWGWVGLLCIDIPNQVTGLEEDKVNKPFRPLVQGLITPTRAWQWLGVAALGWIGLAMYWDVVVPTVLFLAASAVYNGTSFPQHWIGKHLCNAWGYGCYYAAASRLAYLDLLAMQGAPGPEVIEVLSQWVVMHMVVIFMTISIQDLRDVEGDVKVGRYTQNLAWGEPWTRRYLGGCMLIFTMGRHWWFRTLPTTQAMEGVLAYVYVGVIWVLVAWVNYRLVRDCPKYLVVEYANGEHGIQYEWQIVSVKGMDSALRNSEQKGSWLVILKERQSEIVIIKIIKRMSS